MKYAVAIVMTLLVACGSKGGGGSPDANPLAGVTSIAVTPADQTLTIASSAPASSTYVATATFADGHSADVTAIATFAIDDPSLGTFGGPLLKTTDSHGGQTQVTATVGTITGATRVTIKLAQSWNDPASTGLPTNPAGLFGGATDAARAPGLVYPNDGVVVPPNLGRLELHFYPGTNNTLFELRFASAVLDVKVYLRCTTPLNNGCVYQPDATLWGWLARSAAGGEPVTWSLRGTDDAGTAVGTSGTAAMRFAPDGLDGGIYYWTTSNGTGVMRYDFGSTTQTAPEKYLGTELTGDTCVGCHALSRDGTKLVAEAGGQNDGRVLLLDVGTKQPKVPFASTAKSNFEAWAPDGNAFVGVYADSGADDYNLMTFDGSTGAKTGTIDVGGSATHPIDHPDWSPTGDRIAFVKVGQAQTLQRMFNGGIATVAQAGGTWGAATDLVPAASGKNRYYPAFSPDGAQVVFDESTCNTGNTGDECDADTDPTATLWSVPVAGGAPVALARANAPGVADGATTALTNSFPKWNPFVGKRDASGGRLAWITFSSTRRYGLRQPPGSGTLLWMAAIDLDAPAGTDPSAAAFALPFQDVSTSNHIAQWTTKIVVVN
ncbi:MAG: hypothetical protein K8W52_26240 [Deltaproteobacteria bacterium]|nr:hypothetical protein [Deltaproteobacteria bacterium]